MSYVLVCYKPKENTGLEHQKYVIKNSKSVVHSNSYAYLCIMIKSVYVMYLLRQVIDVSRKMRVLYDDLNSLIY